MNLPFVVTSYLLIGIYTICGANYHRDPTCIPLCTSDSPHPNVAGNPNCLCTPTGNVPGCQVSPCGPGDNSSGSYTCQCTEYFQPNDCITLRCDNGTLKEASSPYQLNSYPALNHQASSYPGSGYPATNYPATNYPTPNYPAPNYPAPNYPAPNYPATNYPTSNYPALNYPASFYRAPNYQTSYNYPTSNYPIYSSTCNNYCACEPYLPADCTDDSIPPIVGGPPCACTQDSWPTGCTLKPCQEGDTGDEDYFCECTPTHSPDFCLTPRCTIQ